MNSKIINENQKNLSKEKLSKRVIAEMESMTIKYKNIVSINTEVLDENSVKTINVTVSKPGTENGTQSKCLVTMRIDTLSSKKEVSVKSYDNSRLYFANTYNLENENGIFNTFCLLVYIHTES